MIGSAPTDRGDSGRFGGDRCPNPGRRFVAERFPGYREREGEYRTKKPPPAIKLRGPMHLEQERLPQAQRPKPWRALGNQKLTSSADAR
jgi:hypothetical protein